MTTMRAELSFEDDRNLEELEEAEDEEVEIWRPGKGIKGEVSVKVREINFEGWEGVTCHETTARDYVKA